MIINIFIKIYYRYLRREFVTKGSIIEHNLPQYLAIWVDKLNDLCIFEASHIQI